MQRKEVLLSFNVEIFYPANTPSSEIDSFQCVKFRFDVKRGNLPRQWDYRILSCPDDDHDLYLVKGRFYFELVHKICGQHSSLKETVVNSTKLFASSIEFKAKPDDLMKLLSM